MKNCIVCNKSFENPRYNAKYCSKSCGCKSRAEKEKTWRKQNIKVKDRFQDFYESPETYKVNL